MSILPIVIAPDARLKTVARPVEAVTDAVRRLMDDMLETMYAAPGVGLAAPQVGILSRVIVLDIAEKDEPPAPRRLANPEILWQSDELNTYNEGCLSIPETYADITRPARCRISYLDENNTKQTIEADGLLATCLQHEIDHLNGILFTDYLSALKRGIIMKRMAKAKKNGEFE